MAKKPKTKVDKTGKTANEQFVKMTRAVLLHPAYIALSGNAKVLYQHIKMEAYGARNGKVHLSVEEAARRLGVSANTANKAFHELQAKGFLVLTSFGALGIEGKRSSPTYAVTEYPIHPEVVPRQTFRDWKPHLEFPVQRHGTNNPNGWNGKTHLKA